MKKVLFLFTLIFILSSCNEASTKNNISSKNIIEKIWEQSLQKALTLENNNNFKTLSSIKDTNNIEIDKVENNIAKNEEIVLEALNIYDELSAIADVKIKEQKKQEKNNKIEAEKQAELVKQRALEEERKQAELTKQISLEEQNRQVELARQRTLEEQKKQVELARQRALEEQKKQAELTTKQKLEAEKQAALKALEEAKKKAELARQKAAAERLDTRSSAS